MSYKLVIVESPAKCDKIEKYLGAGYKCIASFGHLQQLVSLKDIDINNNRNNHHFTNITIKLELIVSQIKKNLSKFIIFSDATIFINKLNVNKVHISKKFAQKDYYKKYT